MFTKEELEYILMCIDFTQGSKGCDNFSYALRERIEDETNNDQTGQ